VRGIVGTVTMLTATMALAASALLLGTVITILVLLRRGDGPVYSASRLYDANRREAVRLLTGAEVAAVPAEQWFERARREASAGDPLEPEVRAAVFEGLLAVVPGDRGLVIEDGRRARLHGAVVVPAVSIADVRASGALEPRGTSSAPDVSGTPPADAGLVIALVLVNPEPPGGDARRVALPVQVLFPALERAGRQDLVQRFAALRERAAEPAHAEVP
jgi:hypothetical protein